MSESFSEYETHEIDGLDPIRGRKGTGLIEIAGAASYWQRRAKIAERIKTNTWRNGFTAGLAMSGVLVLVTLAIRHLWTLTQALH